MNAVDVVVIPSEDDPFPMAGIEAMACGTPVITSDRCGTAELAANGPGASYPTGDTGALGKLLREACAGDWKRARGGLGPLAVREYTWRHVTGILTALYERAGGMTKDKAHQGNPGREGRLEHAEGVGN
jgi:glycosyltransferase involved in cell wall biosynthesis